MGRIEDKLDELGLSLPTPMTPPGNYQPVLLHAGLAYVAGHGPFDGSTPLMQGVVGRDLTVDEGYEAARLTALTILASLKRELGELDRVTHWLRVVGYVQTAPDFGQNAAVINGFSDHRLLGPLGCTPVQFGRGRRPSTFRSSSMRIVAVEEAGHAAVSEAEDRLQLRPRCGGQSA
jgi:enamine deaminase RidA (YjgF/YER057c/UK114 family)